MLASNKEKSDRQPLMSLKNFGNLPRSKANKRHFDDFYGEYELDSTDSYDDKENYFVRNDGFTEIRPKIQKWVDKERHFNQLKKVHSYEGWISGHSLSAKSLNQFNKNGSFDYVIQKQFKSTSGLSKLSNAFVPSSGTPPASALNYKSLRNLNCSETVVFSKKDSKAKEILNDKCSKSGRIPNEMKYKTEL